MNNEPKTPPLFSAFYDATMSLITKNRKERLADSIKKTMATEERLLELSDAVTRGREAKKFLSSDFWIDHMEPYLRAEAVLKPAGLRDGDAGLADRVYHEFLVGSGQVRVVTRLLAKLDEWQTQAIDAEKIIKMESEKRQRLSESGD